MSFKKIIADRLVESMAAACEVRAVDTASPDERSVQKVSKTMFAVFPMQQVTEWQTKLYISIK